jgi:predicted Zn-dependent protease
MSDRKTRHRWPPLGACVAFSLFFNGLIPNLAQADATSAPESARAEAPIQAAWLPLARAALAEGDVIRAGRALAGARDCFIEHGAACGFERVAYEALLGVVYFEAGDFARAAETLQAVVAERPDDAALWLALAQSHRALKQWPAADIAFGRAEALGEHRPAVYALWARARRDGGDAFGPVLILQRGLAHHPDEALLSRELALHLARFGALQAAEQAAEALQFAETGSATAAHPTTEDASAESATAENVALWRRLAEARLDGGDPQGAALNLERARRARPDDSALQAQHAAALAAAGQHHAAARLWARAARVDSAHAAAAAEQARRAGDFGAALRLNRRVPDAATRLRQRVELLIAADRPAEALSLGTRATTLDEALRVRLGWAALQTGDATRAVALLRGVSSALGLRLQTIAQDCNRRDGGC